VLDALQFGYAVVLLTYTIKSVNKKPRDTEHAIVEMVDLGAVTTTL
jgi:nicotinamidase-related amidase